MPHGKICYLEIPARRAEDSATFYSGIFGWKTRQRGDGQLAFDDAGGVSGTWVKEADRSPDEQTRIYIMVDDIAEALRQIQAAGGRRSGPAWALLRHSPIRSATSSGSTRSRQAD